jgi:hypothetical protein
MGLLTMRLSISGGERQRRPKDEEDFDDLAGVTIDDSVRRPNDFPKLRIAAFGHKPPRLRECLQLIYCEIELADDSEGVGRRVFGNKGLDVFEIPDGLFSPPDLDHSPSRALASS